MSSLIADGADEALQKLIRAHEWECKRRRALELLVAHLAQQGSRQKEIDALELHYIRVVNALPEGDRLDLSAREGGVAARYAKVSESA